MKIVSWNCHGRFRDKYSCIQHLNADIYVIQECENPQRYCKEFSGFCRNHVWYGEKDSKGLAVFAKQNIGIRVNDWPFYCLRHFVSVRVNDDFDLLGVWASPPYIEEYYVYQAINIERYNRDTVIIGDFNSNAIWDKKNKQRNHSAVVKILSEKNLISAYHYMTGEEQGKESKATFCMYGHRDKPYHIDHCFLAAERIRDFQVLEANEWLRYSDHMPLVLEID